MNKQTITTVTRLVVLALLATAPAADAGQIEYSSYLGGADGSDEAIDIAVDTEGCAYVLGFTGSSDFPLSGAFDTTLDPGFDGFVTKFAADGSSIVYSTYIGGSGNDNFPHGGIAVDAAGHAYIAGLAAAPDFPVTAGAFQDTSGGLSDGYVAKLSPDGSSLIYSTFLGGSVHDHCTDIAIDANGNAYVCGTANSANFPTTPGAYDSTMSPTDAFVAKLNASGDALVFSTFVGGSSAETATAIALLGDEPIVCGDTQSNNFPVVGAVQSVRPGARDGFVCQLNSTGSALNFSTYLGGESADGAYGITVDTDGSIYVTGYTDSDSFPATPGAFQPTHPRAGVFGADAAFVTKLAPGGSPVVYSTYLGGANGFTHGDDIAVYSGLACAFGGTTSDAFPLANEVQGLPPAVLPGNAFVSQFAADGSSLLFSTYLGGTGDDQPREGSGGIAADGNGAVYVAASTGSSDFPTTPGAFQENDPGIPNSLDAFVVKLSTGTASAVSPPAAMEGPARRRGLELAGGPNPFRDGVRLSFALAEPGTARIEVFDATGRRVRAIEGRGLPAGTSSVEWDGREESGAPAAAGVYFLRLEAGGESETIRAVLVR